MSTSEAAPCCLVEQNAHAHLYQNLWSALATVETMDAAALASVDALRMATADAARACRVQSGVLEVGRPADIIVVLLDRPHLRPINDVLGTLVFCGRADDVRDTIIDGQIVMRDRRVLAVDEDALVREVERAARLLRHARYESPVRLRAVASLGRLIGSPHWVASLGRLIGSPHWVASSGLRACAVRGKMPTVA